MYGSDRRSLRIAFLVLLTLLPTSAPSTPPLPTIGGYVKVSELRVTRTITEYVYQATLTNAGPALAGATALASSASGATMIVEGGLAFGPVGAGGDVVSTDTFTFRHDRTVPFDFANIQWSITPLESNRPPVANAGPDQTADVGALVTLDGSGSSDLDGDPLTYGWAFQSRPSGSGATLENQLSVNPTFVVDVAGTFVVQLIVNDGTTSSAADTVVIDTDNSAPVANAGPDQTTTVGQTVTLDGSASSDFDGDALTFTWGFDVRPPGSAAVLSDPAAVHPQFTVDEPGTYRLRLVVNDGTVASAPDLVDISTQNSAPIANAGADQSVPTGSTVALNGSGSTDADGDPLTYLWSLTSVPGGSAAALSNPTSVTPTFLVDLPGAYIAQLIVDDGSGPSAPDTVTISTENSAPRADAGPDQSVVAGQAVVLDGTGSSDPDGDALSFDWAITLRPSGSTATLDDPLSGTPSFIADLPGSYVVQLTVDDGTANSTPDTVTIATTNSAPVADAGPDQHDVPVDSTVTLNGSASTDADGHPLTYSWSLLSRPTGSAAELDSLSAVSPTFTAEVVGDYVAQLIVNDGFVSSAPDTVLVRVAEGELPTVTIVATDGSGSEAGDAGAFSVSRSGPTTNGLTVSYSIGGTATNGTDYQTIATSVLIPAGAASASVPVAPLPDALAEGDEDVTLTLAGGTSYQLGTPSAATVTIVDAPPPPVVTVTAVDSSASEIGPNTGTFRFARTGVTTAALTVLYTTGGTALNGTDYASIAGSIVIPAGSPFADLTITPIVDGVLEPAELATITLTDTLDYDLGSPAAATVTIADGSPLVSVSATDPGTSENGPDTGTFTFTRIGSAAAPLTVNFTVAGTATAGSDYTNLGMSVTIPASQASTTAVVTPLADGVTESPESVIVTLAAGAYNLGAPSSATVTISDCAAAGATLVNGAMHCGTIDAAGEAHSWTFTAIAGDRIAVHVGEMFDSNDFRPWIRLSAPNGTLLASTSGVAAAAVDSVLAPLTGTYVVLVASFDSGFDGTGSYRISMAKTTGSITVSPGDQGGPLTNGGMHTGEIVRGDLDVWTFTANAGDRIAVHAGEIVDTNDFRPWLRLYAPDGNVLANTSGVAAAVIDGVLAPVAGTYLVLVASFDSGFDGIGTYRLTMTKTPGPITVSAGDQGGPLTNGGMHTGEILRGDLDVWTFTATAGDRIAVHLGEIADNDDFRPWLRLYAPSGSVLANTSGVTAAVIDGTLAPVTGTYLVLVATFETGFDGTGTYRITMAKTPGPITVSAGDQGGPLTNGGMHTGEILRGDLDVWTFTANMGERIAVHAGQIAETDDFRPWLRLYAPNGDVLANTSGVTAAVIDGAVAPATGTYLVLVASFDSAFDGVGTYRLTMTKTPGPITVSAGDEGGPLTNGGMHTGEMLLGDLDVWTFTATAGDRLAVHAGEIADNDDFRPWLRLYAPNGTVLASTSGTEAAVIDGALAPVTGTYLVLVATFDSAFDGTGTYRLTMTKTPGPITVSAGDEGGPLSNGGMHTGEILRGDLDVWTLTALAGERIAVHAGQIAETDDFRPWLRLYAPNGTVLANTSGTEAAVIDSALAPVTGTYLVLVASFDSGFGGIGTYRLTMTKTPGPITVSAGDEGGPLTNGGMHTGAMLLGDLDVWTFTATAGDRIAVHAGEIADTGDFRPWLRLYAPSGATLASTSGTDAAVIDGVLAPVTGTYLVLVASFDSGFDGTGTYRMTMTKTPGPIVVSAGDQGGALTSGVSQAGAILQGDLDVWTITAGAGQPLAVTVTQTSETDDFRPWLRVYGPDGTVLANTSGLDTATANIASVPASGVYLILVSSFDSGFDGVGTYSVLATTP